MVKVGHAGIANSRFRLILAYLFGRAAIHKIRT